APEFFGNLSAPVQTRRSLHSPFPSAGTPSTLHFRAPSDLPIAREIMRWLQSEYLLKGVYLGLLLYAALRQGEGAGEPAESLLKANLPPLAGLVLAMAAAAVLKMRDGYRVNGRPVVFALILLLESGTLVYAGIIGGALVGAWLLRPPGEGDLL